MRLTTRSVITCALLVGAPACAPAQAPAIEPDPPRTDLGKQLHYYLEGRVPLGFSGAFLVARGGEVVLHEGYGLADRENETPYTARTVFDIGSITKQFTAAAILKLEEEGRLRTSDPISRFFPNTPEDKQSVTVHHLLAHSAGLLGDFGHDYEVMPRDSLVGLVLASRLQSEPGTRYAYSNAGYSLLGAIVEIASGQSYEQYLHARLFAPAGMQKTGYITPDWADTELAVGYRANGGRWGTPLDPQWAPDGPWWNLRANGGLLSTLGDLYQWHLALHHDLVLSAESKAKLFAPHIAMDADGTRHYGYGWMLATTQRDTRVISHSGGNPYFVADFSRYVDEDVVILMASNAPDQQETVVPVRRQVIAMVFGAPPPASQARP